jgi:serine/threonine protein kinase/tetratricopeptide (TPR) repeat protein
MIGQTVSHYRIIEELGGGGMGVVYRAEDTKLKRNVALKFLPPELTRDTDAKIRFIHEAQAASALQHNNICTIHEIDETPDGQLFICMDLYEGETLKEKIAGGPLAFDDAIKIAAQIGQGLEEAHKVGVVHRDVKPANIMITPSGVVKILDFGLAKLAGMTRVTRAGSTVGTVPYMSPEQARGEEVDERSDIWSLGAVLYEMLTGSTPFTGDHQAAVMYGIMHTDPTPLSISRHDAPDSAQIVIDKALRKSQDERYQRISELLADLRSEVSPGDSMRSVGRSVVSPARRYLMFVIVTAAIVVVGMTIYKRFFTPSGLDSPPQRKMLAVLPFENLGFPEDEYFADGMTDEIITRLAGIHGLGVIARTSVMQYKQTRKTIQQIGEELGVDYIVEGTVRWQHSGEAPARVRVTPQLIAVADATHLWADVYDETATELFSIQSEIAGKVRSELDVTLGEPGHRTTHTQPTENFDAYTKYLRAREQRLKSIEEETLLSAAQFYSEAIEIDSTFALAWAELSWVHDLIYWERYWQHGHHALKAKEAADIALTLDSSLPEANLAMGLYHYHQLSDYDEALKYFERAARIQPSNFDAFWMIGATKRRQGRMKEGLEDYLLAAKLNPRSAALASEVGWTYVYHRDFESGARYLARAVSLAPDVFDHRRSKARIHGLYSGDSEAARREIEEMRERGLDTSMPKRFQQFMLPFDLCVGDYDRALTRLPFFPEVQNHHYGFVPRTLHYADLHRWSNNMDLAIAYYDSARTTLEEAAKSSPGDARIHSSLGIAYAGLGRREDALREGELAVDLLPISKDALRGYIIAIQLAKIYAAAGEYDAAVDQIEYLLSVPGPFPVAELRCNPSWAPLRDHPRFEALFNE